MGTISNRTTKIIALAAIGVSGLSLTASAGQLMQQAMTPHVTAEWLSAWSTFWGAVATAIGALLTAGALLIAAFSFKHQVDEKRREADDKRRAQARAVRIAVSPRTGWDEFACDMRNYGELPVSDVNVVSVNAAGEETMRHVVGLLIPGTPIRETVPGPLIPSTSYASFRDTEGLSWKLYFDDRLEEQVPAKAVAS